MLLFGRSFRAGIFMGGGSIGRRALFSWLSLALLVILVCLLAVLQYRWIGEISEAEQKNLQEQLQGSLNELSRGFNAELSVACAALSPSEAEVNELGREAAYERRHRLWRQTTRRPELFSRITIAWQESGQPVLRILDPGSGRFVPAEWPAEWSSMRDWVASRSRRPQRPAGSEPRGESRGPGSPKGDRKGPLPRQGSRDLDDTTLIDVPRFGGAGDGPGGEFGRGEEQDWLLVEVSPEYAANTLLPDLLARYLGENYADDYQVEVFARGRPSHIIYRTDDQQALSPNDDPDALVTLFSGAPRGFGSGPLSLRPSGPGSGARDRGEPPARKDFGGPGDAGRGRWQLSVRAKAGSLAAVVGRARQRNLAISAVILLLLLATGVALLRFSRQAQRLADVEMEFVAGVSHELRTPLTVIRTAAYNLRGKLATNPSQVEQYGELIQRESEKLTALLEQVLRFAGTKKGRVIHEREPFSVERLIDTSLQSSKAVLEETRCQVEKQIEPGLAPIFGDATALQYALQNLITNAVKYGIDGERWLGIFAAGVAVGNKRCVEIRVEDRGPGIPSEEQKHIFDAFYRGKKAVQDQIHGTGLGLNLVKKTVEAHGGTVHIQSQTGSGTSLIIRIPVGNGRSL
jgi:signal transduction histidine kinase